MFRAARTLSRRAARRASSASGDGFVARARGPFRATNKAELSFAKGDVLLVLEKAHRGWLFAQLGDTTGLVPSSYVEKIEAEVRPLVSSPSTSQTDFVRCVACQQELTPQSALLCSGCLCVSYCSAACAVRHATKHSAADCADHARYARRDVRVSLPAPEPAWLAAAMDHRGTSSLCATLERIGVHSDPDSQYRLLCGCAGPATRSATPHRPQVAPIEGTIEGSPAISEGAAGIAGAAGAAVTAGTAGEAGSGCREEARGERGGIAPGFELPRDWAAFHTSRGIPTDAPLAALLSFPLTVARILGQLRLTEAGRLVRVHYLGPEKELAMWPIFRELAVLMPRQELLIEMVCAGSSTLKLPREVRFAGRLGGSVTIRACGGGGAWYHDGTLGLAPPDVAVALNAGLAVPNYNWGPTLLQLGHAATPFFFTDYSEYSAERGVAFALQHGMTLTDPVSLNPFRAPLRQGLVNGGSVGFPWLSNGFIAGFNTGQVVRA